MKRAAVIGTGHDGPRHGRGARPGRASRSRCTTSAPRRSSAPRPASSWPTACSTGSRRRASRAAASRYESDLAAALAGAEFVIEAIPERLELKQELFAEFEQHVGAGRDPRLQHVGHPDHEDRRRPGASRARRGHALVEPAAPHPDDRGHPRRADQPGDRRRVVALVNDIGYDAVVKQEVPGFVENRILYAIMRECLDLVDRGIIDAEGMDRNVQAGASATSSR